MISTRLGIALLTSVLAASPALANQEGEEEVFTPNDEAEKEDKKTDTGDALRAAPKPAPPPADDPATTGDEVGTENVKMADEFSVERGRRGSNDSAIATPGQPALVQRAKYDLDVFGYIRLVTTAVQNDSEVEFVGRNDGFRLQNARIGVEGRLGEFVMLRLSADGANDRRQGPNDVEGELQFGLADAFADIKNSKALQLRIGRFPAIFDLERFTSAVQRGFISRSLESRGVSPTEGFESPGLGVRRSLGIAVRAPKAFDTGSFALGYEVAAQNGNGDLASTNDNDALAYSATVIGHISDIGLVFLSGRYNERTEGELPFRRTERDFGTAFGLWVENQYLRVAGQLIFQRTTFKTTGEPEANAWGGHAEFLAKLPFIDGLVAGYRFALLDESDRIPANRVIEHTVGAGIDLPSYGLGLKLNLTLPIEEAGRELDNVRTEALVEVQL
ncbi:MAG: OprO/OprP family phosphate-selective porin [Deltaproteobacteria bacterium]|nr:OprO/OprP family phosphate-selective porin [Deltaproteobacteria bacterium]